MPNERPRVLPPYLKLLQEYGSLACVAEISSSLNKNKAAKDCDR